MRLAYLVTTYPHISHSFVRREIAALEAGGACVSRFSLRSSTAELADAADRAELSKTRVILRAGAFGLLIAVLRVMVLQPRSFARSLALALRLAWSSQRGVLRHVGYLAEACCLLQPLKSEGIQHLHAHFAANSAAVAMLCQELGGPPYSFTAHGIEAFDAPAAISLGEKIKRAQFVVAVCEHGRSQLCRWSAPAEWSKIHVIRCGVDEKFLAYPRTEPPAAPRMVVVARLGPEKGHLVLLEAVALLLKNKAEIELVLVGEGPMRPELEAGIKKMHLGHCVRIEGWRSGVDVRDEILASRALILPSFAEGLPVVLMEALALGRPVISTYVAGIPELVENGVTGWLVPAGSAERLAEAIQDALKAPIGKLSEMGRQGTARVAQCHDATREAAKLVDMFRRAVVGTEPVRHNKQVNSAITAVCEPVLREMAR